LYSIESSPALLLLQQYVLLFVFSVTSMSFADVTASRSCEICHYLTDLQMLYRYRYMWCNWCSSDP